VRNPIYPASNADLRLQYQFLRAIEAESALVADGQKRADALLKSRGAKMTPAMLAQLNAIIGMAPKNSPDDSVGKPAMDFNSLRYIGAQLQSLEGSNELGDARPDPEDYATFHILQKKAASALRTLHMLELAKP